MDIGEIIEVGTIVPLELPLGTPEYVPPTPAPSPELVPA